MMNNYIKKPDLQYRCQNIQRYKLIMLQLTVTNTRRQVLDLTTRQISTEHWRIVAGVLLYQTTHTSLSVDVFRGTSTICIMPCIAVTVSTTMVSDRYVCMFATNAHIFEWNRAAVLCGCVTSQHSSLSDCRATVCFNNVTWPVCNITSN